MINVNPSMSIDLYGLSISPPARSTINPTGSPPPPSSTTDLSSIDTKQNSPVIYPWMRKVHINNPGNQHSFIHMKRIFNKNKNVNRPKR